MRSIALGTSAICLVICVLAVASCSDSSEPNVEPDTDGQAPTARISLSITRFEAGEDYCPIAGFFFADPRASRDNATALEDLMIRWDFDDDGQWDTAWKPIAVQWIELDTPPVQAWTVRAEVQDLAGNVGECVESIALPDWLPDPPDVLAGTIHVYLDSGATTDVDTLLVGQEFEVSVGHRDWVPSPGETIANAFYFDDVLVSSFSLQTGLPSLQRCSANGFVYRTGFADAGVHTIRAVLDVADDLVETNEDNNTSTKTVVVVER